MKGQQKKHPVDNDAVIRDWDWWSNFLQREYYGSPDEQAGWDAAAAAIASAVDLHPGMTVLDLGSGSGDMTFRLALRGVLAVGIERSEALVQHCRTRGVELGVAAEFIAADMFSFEPERTFDVIISINTSFGYGTDEQNRALIAKIGRWLNPGGAFYLDLCTADHAEPFGTWSDELAGGELIVENTYDREERRMISLPSWIGPEQDARITADVPEVVQLYTREDLERMMRDAGMEPRRLERAMGRRFKQTDDQMLSTWVARKIA